MHTDRKETRGRYRLLKKNKEKGCSGRAGVRRPQHLVQNQLRTWNFDLLTARWLYSCAELPPPPHPQQLLLEWRGGGLSWAPALWVAPFAKSCPQQSCGHHLSALIRQTFHSTLQSLRDRQGQQPLLLLLRDPVTALLQGLNRSYITAKNHGSHSAVLCK